MKLRNLVFRNRIDGNEQLSSINKIIFYITSHIRFVNKYLINQSFKFHIHFHSHNFHIWLGDNKTVCAIKLKLAVNQYKNICSTNLSKNLNNFILTKTLFVIT